MAKKVLFEGDRLFVGVFPGGISYADRGREKNGDWARLAFLGFSDLELKVEDDCPADLRARIVCDAAEIQARKGEHYQTSTCGQGVTLGSELIKKEKEAKRLADAREFMIDKMSEYIGMADGWSCHCTMTLWLYFNGEDACREVARRLKAAGYRRLEAFPSPAGATEQLAFTLTVNMRATLETKHSKSLEQLIRELGIDPIQVMDLYDRTFLVELDSAIDNSRFRTVFKPIFEKAVKGNRVELHQRWAKDHLGLTRQYRLHVGELEASDAN